MGGIKNKPTTTRPMLDPTSISKSRFSLRSSLCIAGTASLMALGSAHAGQASFDFSVDPTTDPAGKLTIVGNNDAPWQAAGGNPGGFLAITYPVGSQSTGIIFPDIDTGKIVGSFQFECDLRVGNSTGNRAADGFSISFARAADPYLASLPDSAVDSNFGGNCCYETGTKTGIAISFDTWSGNTFPNDPVDKSDVEGIIIRVDDVTVKKVPTPTRHGTCTDATSLQTGPRNAQFWTDGGDPKDPVSWSELCWAKFFVSVDASGKVTVKFKGVTLLDQFQTSYFPSAGRLVMAGRTGGANEHTHVDNIKLTTTSFVDNSPPTAPSNLTGKAIHPRRVQISWAGGTDDSGRVAYEIERDGVVLPTIITGTSYSQTAKPDTSYSFKVRTQDPALNKSAFTAAVTVKTPVEVLSEQKGFAKYEFYGDIAGGIDEFVADPKFPGSPDDARVLSAFEGPTGIAENYGARVSGYFTPATGGDYVFYMSTDDGGRLFLSTDDKPANKKQIAAEPTWNGERNWVGLDRRDPDLPENRSDKYAATEWATGNKITLTAGKKYYLELLYKEGGGGDNGAVFVKKASDPDPANGAPALGGDQISALIDPNQGKPSITSQPKAGALSVSAVGTQPLSYQWKKTGLVSGKTEEIAGATGTSFTVTDSTAALYSVEVRNEEGLATSRSVMTLPAGAIFIEAEDFDFGGGKTITDKEIGMNGKYAGGLFQDLGTDADAGIDYNNPGGNAGQSYRPGTGVAAGKKNSHAAGLPRGAFDVEVNHVVGWNDANADSQDWQNYTRTFPAAADYTVIARLSSGGQPLEFQLDEVTSGVGTTTQTLKKLGGWKPGRATPSWDTMEWFDMTDDAGKQAVVNLGGKKTLRLTMLPGNGDSDYLIFVPAAPALPPNVLKAGDPITSSHAVSDSPAGEQVALAIDGKTSTKYLNFKKLNTGFTVTPSAGASVITGIRLTSANDSPDRDPASYILEGSNDGTSFTQISQGAVAKFSKRFEAQAITFANTAAYKTFRVTFPTVANATAANSMQIAEVELLGVPGTVAPTASISLAGGKISITYQGTLESADSVTGPYTPVAGATSPFSADPTAGAKYYRFR